MIDEPYVLASQVSQVFYVKDVRHKYWTVEVKTKPKEVFDVGIYASHDNDDDDDEMRMMTLIPTSNTSLGFVLTTTAQSLYLISST